MAGQQARAVFFDATRTLGRTLLSADGTGVVRFEPYAATPALLRRLRGPASLGLLAFGEPAAAEVLQAGLNLLGSQAVFEPNLVEAQAVAEPAQFTALAERAATPAELCLFVSRDPERRRAALEAGFRVAPSAKYVPAVLVGEQVTYVRLRPATADAASVDALLSIAGFDLLELGVIGPPLFGLVTESARRALRQASYAVEDLMPPATAAVTTLYLIRDGLDPAFVRHVRRELELVEATPAGLMIGVPAGRTIGEFHPRIASHGHTIRVPFAVAPRHALAAETARRDTPAADMTGAPPPPPGAAPPPPPPPAATAATPCNPPNLPVGPLSPTAADTLVKIDAALLRQFLEPLVGVVGAKVPGSVTITSRAIDNDQQNAFAVDHLAAELQAILGGAAKSPFTCDLGTRYNVLAEITGAACPQSVVVVGAHLDSTAASTSGWVKRSDAAPGADDDASGVAGVLAAATVLAQLGAPKRTIRFVLFNGEEGGMLGSNAYCEDLNDIGTEQVTAMLQMDMIGHRTGAVVERRIEIHPPGSTDFNSVWPQVIARSQALAGVIKAAATVSPGLEPQVYPIPPCATDPVAWRSDHTSFLVAQMTACAVSEELFGDSCATPGAHPHPGYHTVNDTPASLDMSYAADIARVVAAAAWMIANG